MIQTFAIRLGQSERIIHRARRWLGTRHPAAAVLDQCQQQPWVNRVVLCYAFDYLGTRECLGADVMRVGTQVSPLLRYERLDLKLGARRTVYELRIGDDLEWRT
jgi:hypothetical protein